ncbi:hypothetical protein CWI37_1196p0010, partial [Hamiltosporidium tvaerminnensis]
EEAEVKEEEAVSECNCDEDNDYLNELEAERKKKNAVLKAKQLEDRKKVEKNVIPSIKAESAINDKLMRDAYERRLRDYERAFVLGCEVLLRKGSVGIERVLLRLGLGLEKRSNIFILDKIIKNKMLSDVVITSQDSLQIVEIEKFRKYDLLAKELGIFYVCIRKIEMSVESLKISNNIFKGKNPSNTYILDKNIRNITILRYLLKYTLFWLFSFIPFNIYCETQEDTNMRLSNLNDNPFIFGKEDKIRKMVIKDESSYDERDMEIIRKHKGKPIKLGKNKIIEKVIKEESSNDDGDMEIIRYINGKPIKFKRFVDKIVKENEKKDKNEDNEKKRVDKYRDILRDKFKTSPVRNKKKKGDKNVGGINTKTYYSLKYGTPNVGVSKVIYLYYVKGVLI